MSHKTIVFQFATHYLVKIALRLERLFFAIDEARHETHPIIHHYALKNIIEILKIIEKPELKSRFVKELMRLEHVIPKATVKVSEERFANLFVQVQVLNHMAGRFGEAIHQDPFLQTIRLGQSGHGIDCELQSPQLIFWLENDYKIRQRNLDEWLKTLKALNNTVKVYLSLLRDIVKHETIEVYHGFFQRSLSTKIMCHLVLLSINSQLGIVPKLQMGHHGLSLSFNDAYTMQEVKPDQVVQINLAICQL